MATPQQLNVKLDPQTGYTFEGTFADDTPDEIPIDISTWSFKFQMRDSGNNLIWDLTNSDFSRPSTGVITFTKTQSQIAALSEGLYTIQLLVTKAGAVDDIYLTGYYEK